jgi:hypothetical protein
MDRNELIRTACARHELDAAIAESIVSECPWLDATTSIANELGGELIRMSGVQLSQSDAESFMATFNEQLRLRDEPLRNSQSAAYSEVSAILRHYGQEGIEDDADFWLHDDSFSDQTPTIYVFRAFRPNERALAELKSVLLRYSHIYKELIICTNDDRLIAVVSPNDA